MRLLLDMGLARTTAHAMRAAGHEAVHLRDEGRQRLDDASIVDKAVVERFRGDLERGALVTVDDQGVRVRPLPVSAG